MDRRLLYAFRGFVGFVAFIDIGSAARAYIEKRSFLGDHSDSNQIHEGNLVSSRVLGMFCVLKAFALIHSTLFIHFKQVVSMGSCSLVITLLLYLSEALYYRSTTLNFYVVFPCVLNFITLIGLIYIPRRLRLWESIIIDDDENSQLLRRMGNYKKRRLQQSKRS